MNKLKLAWQADAHLGFRQYGLERRERDFQDAFRLSLKLAQAKGAKGVIDCGDVLHNTRPSPETVLFLLKLNEELIADEFPVFIISGNHDYTKPHWIDVIFGEKQNGKGGIKLVDNSLFEFEGLRILGIPQMSKEMFIQRSLQFPECDIMMFHGMIQEFVGYPAENALQISDLPLDKCQVFAMGDIHINDVTKVKGTLIGYPGSLELNSQSEPSDKKFVMLEFEDGKLTNHYNVPVPTRPVITVWIENETQLEAFIADTEKEYLAISKKKPIVFVEYQTSSTLDVMGRIKAKLDPDDYILREEPYMDKAVKTSSTAQQATLLSPTDFLRSVLQPDPEVADLANKIIQPGIKADTLIEQFITTQLA